MEYKFYMIQPLTENCEGAMARSYYKKYFIEKPLNTQEFR